MEDVSGRFVAADRYLKAQDFVRMNRTGSLPANREAQCQLSLGVEIHRLADRKLVRLDRANG
jgi:hypothetical protein